MHSSTRHAKRLVERSNTFHLWGYFVISFLSDIGKTVNPTIGSEPLSTKEEYIKE